MSREAQDLARRLLAMDWPDATQEIIAMAKSRTPKAGRLLIELIDHRSSDLRHTVLDSLWQFGRMQDARKAARVGIESKNFFVRNTAAEMMELVGATRDVPALISRLQSDKSWVIRASAASSLGGLRTKAGLAALEDAMQRDRYWCVRAYAAHAICRKGDQRFAPLILQRIKKEPEPAVLPSLYSGMFMLGQPQFREKAIDLLFEDDYWYMVYLRTCVALESMYLEEGETLPDRAIVGLKRVMKYDVGKAAKWASRDLLAKVGIVVKGSRSTSISTSSGKRRA